MCTAEMSPSDGDRGRGIEAPSTSQLFDIFLGSSGRTTGAESRHGIVPHRPASCGGGGLRPRCSPVPCSAPISVFSSRPDLAGFSQSDSDVLHGTGCRCLCRFRCFPRALPRGIPPVRFRCSPRNPAPVAGFAVFPGPGLAASSQSDSDVLHGTRCRRRSRFRCSPSGRPRGLPQYQPIGLSFRLTCTCFTSR